MKEKVEKTNALRLLDAARVAYTTHAYDVSDGHIDGVSVAAKVGKPPETVFKTIVLLGASRALFVMVVPVAKEISLKAAARAAGEKSVALLPVGELLARTGYIRGGCSPVGMKKRYPTFLDEAARGLAEITVSAGRIGLQMTLAVDALREVTGAAFAGVAE